MDVRNWEFLDDTLASLGAIEKDLSSSGFAEKIAYTAFFWSLIQYHDSEEAGAFRASTLSLPDYLTPANRAKVEHISHVLDAWMQTQDPGAHPAYAKLRSVVEIGLQATTHPIFDPRGPRG